MLRNNGVKTEFSVHSTPQQLAKIKDISLDIDGVAISYFWLWSKYEISCQNCVQDCILWTTQHQYYSKKSNNRGWATAIHAFVTSRLDHCNALLYGLPKVTISQVQRVQNSAARSLVGAKRRDHITPILRNLHWLPITKLVDYKLLVLVYKALNGTGPEYIRELLIVHESGREGLWSAQNVIILVEPRTELVTGGDRSFEKAATCLWNAVPAPLHNVNSLEMFKSGLKSSSSSSCFPTKRQLLLG